MWFYIIVLFICLYLLIKNNDVYHTMSIIHDAILDYNLYQITINDYSKGSPDYIKYPLEHDSNIYTKKVFRFWDWGVDGYLSDEDMIKLKPFIEKRLNSNV